MSWPTIITVYVYLKLSLQAGVHSKFNLLLINMVCVPCIVIPFVLWVFHKFIQPWILKFWNPWAKKEAIDYRESGPPKVSMQFNFLFSIQKT